MNLQLINVFLSSVIIGIFLKLMWDHRRTRGNTNEFLDLDKITRVTQKTLGPFAKSTGKKTPRVNDDEAAYRLENKLDLKDKKH